MLGESKYAFDLLNKSILFSRASSCAVTNTVSYARTAVCWKQNAQFDTGGTRFIGAYLARQLIEEGNEVTLLTRGKAPITSQIPDDTDASYADYKAQVVPFRTVRMEPQPSMLRSKSFRDWFTYA